MKIAFIFLPPWDPCYPSYAMALFRASTKNAGHDFVDFDLNVDLYKAVEIPDQKMWDPQSASLWDVQWDYIIKKYTKYIDSYIKTILKQKIDLYTISINAYSKYLAFHLSRTIKKYRPKACILVGGPQCFPSYDGLNILHESSIDAICTGEGDMVWPQILDHFSKTGQLRMDIPGIAYRMKDNTIKDNGVPESVKNLDALPFADYSQIDFNKYGDKYQLGIMTSRGCINTCAFCSERPNFNKYRHRSAENIFQEISSHLNAFRNNPSFPSTNEVTPYFSFNDSLLNGVPDELEKLCDLIIKSSHRFLWGGMALIRKEMTVDLLVKMKKAGCHNLAWGLESGCQEVLDLMCKKYFNMDLAKKVIKSTHQAGISQAISLIAGFPGETEEMYKETMKFVSDHKDYFAVGVQPMMIAANSFVHRHPEKFGMAQENDWLKWETIDGTNNYDVRLKRVEMLKSLLEGNVKTIDKDMKAPLNQLSQMRDSLSWRFRMGHRIKKLYNMFNI